MTKEQFKKRVQDVREALAKVQEAIEEFEKAGDLRTACGVAYEAGDLQNEATHILVRMVAERDGAEDEPDEPYDPYDEP